MKNWCNILSMRFFKRRVASVETGRDFSLHSGERQTGTCLDAIRRDHRVRYDLAISWLRKRGGKVGELFGLDIFCGNGYGTYMLTQLMGCKVLAIDASAEAIVLANRWYGTAGSFFCGESVSF